MIYNINYQHGHVGLTVIKLSNNYMSDALMPTYQELLKGIRHLRTKVPSKSDIICSR